MRLDSFKAVVGSTKNRKRIGRGHGSGHGKSAGRGDKGAGQRSGNKTRPWFEGGQMPLARRLPRRGFTNIFRKEYQIINLEDLARLDMNIITPLVLFDNGFIRSAYKPVKVLGNGKLNTKIDITASAFSASAKLKIEKSGGTAIVQ